MISVLHITPRRRAKSKHAFTLLETMMALSVFTLVAFSLVVALNGSFEAANARNQVDSVMRGLENRIALAHAGRLLPGETDLPDDNTGITYRLSVVQEQLMDQKKQPVPNIYRATITASWKQDGDIQQRDISFLLYQP